MLNTPSPKKVCILTQFSDYQKAYSLNIIAESQIKMLTSHGYETSVIVSDSFEAPAESQYAKVKLLRIPTVPVHNEVKKDETFDEDVTVLTEELDRALEGIDVVITHDIIYQNACLKHNFAARKIAAKRPNILWLHWIHSATSPLVLSNLRNYFSDEYLNLVSQEFPHSYYIFFNDFSKPRIAQNFNVPQEKVKTVHHPTDICDFLGISPEVAEIVEQKKMLFSDVMATYPIRLDRGKQVQFVLKTMAAIKEMGKEVRIVIIDFHSTGGDKVTYREELHNLAIDLGLNAQDLTFTSETREEWSGEVPRYVVRDFQLLSNVFIMPSVSESYSLITQEAGLLKQVVVLNFDFPPFRDIFGSNAIFRKYSSAIDINTGFDGNTTTQYGPGNASPEERQAHERRYHQETAGLILAKLKDNGAMELSRFLMKERNLEAVFKKELEPLLFLP